MTPTASRVLAALAAAALALTACGDDDDDDAGSAVSEAPSTAEETTAEETTAASETTAAGEDTAPTSESTEPEASMVSAPEDTDDGASGGWTVDTSACTDPDRTNAPIEGTVQIGSSGPLSGGPAAAAFAPVIAGYQAYIDYANENGLLPDHELSVTYGDDQFNPALTPGVINAALDDGAHLISGMIGAPNAFAVRDTLNEECVPQLMVGGGPPTLNDPVAYPWTMGGLLPFTVEAKAYAEDIVREFPDGASVAVYYANNEGGQAFVAGFEQAAGEVGIEIVDTQQVDPADTNPPNAQLSSIAGNAPDVIVTVPLGAQCPVFLNELANHKAANPGWEPRVYLTSVCASSLILGAAGESANGLYTALPTGAVDVTNPANQDLPGVAEYLAYMESKGLTDTVPTSVTGWIFAEVTVETLRQAAESPEGLTQASIMNAARNLDYTPSVVQEGFTYKASGEEDPTYVEAVQIVQYDAATKFLNPVGELITKFESS